MQTCLPQPAHAQPNSTTNRYFPTACVHMLCVRACTNGWKGADCGSREGGRYTVRDVVWGSHSEPVSFPAASVQHRGKVQEDTHTHTHKCLDTVTCQNSRCTSVCSHNKQHYKHYTRLRTVTLELNYRCIFGHCYDLMLSIKIYIQPNALQMQTLHKLNNKN